MTDWFSQSGFAQAMTTAAVSAAVGGDASKAFGGLATSLETSPGWVQNRLSFLKEYFNVTHSYVRWKLIFVWFPFLQRSEAVTRSVSRDFPDQGFDDTTKDTSDGVGLRLRPGRRPDLYIPLMGLISFVLLFGLNKGSNFHPDDLYNVSTYAMVLLVIEVLLLKGASYILSVPTLTMTDVTAVCGYKFANLCLSLFALMFIGGNRTVWIALWLWAAASAGITVMRGLLGASGYYASVSQYMGTGALGNTVKVLSMIAGGLQVFWCWLLMPAFVALAENSAGLESTSSSSIM